MTHIPVLLNEVMEVLDPKPGGKFIDATINGGGHSRAILDRILSTPTESSGPEGKLLGIELDLQIYKNALLIFEREPYKDHILIINDSYVNLNEIAKQKNFTDSDGILFDLGMSSWHIEESGKGFSFMRLEPLDMRYHDDGLTAADILNNYREENLEYIIREYGGEGFAKRIASEVAKFRKNKLFENTFELVEVIKMAVPFWYRMRRIHPATKTFQALRIEVNQELKNIEKGLEEGLKVIKPGGRIAVISFHSLEDKIIKSKFRQWAKEEKGMIVIKKAIKPTYKEVEKNPKARSAKLRVFQK